MNWVEFLLSLKPDPNLKKEKEKKLNEKFQGVSLGRLSRIHWGWWVEMHASP